MADRQAANGPGAPRWLLPAIALAVLAVYWRTLNYPLLAGWDDYSYVVDNTANLRLSWANVWRYLRAPYFHMYHPLTMYSYMLDYNVWGLRGLGYRLQNLLWHLAATAAVLRLLRHFRLDWRLAAVLALIFAVHPQRVESVAWVGERKDVLCVAFYLWAAWAYLAVAGRRGYWLAFGLWVGALLAKPTAVSLPFVLAVWEWYRGESWQPIVRRLGLWFGIAAGFMVLATAAQGSAIDAAIDPVRQLGVVLHNFLWYPARLLAPHDLNPLYPRVSPTGGRVLAVVAGYLAMIWLLWRVQYRHGWRALRPVAALAAAYAFLMAPMIGIVPYALVDYADRYSYLPHVLLLLGVGLMAGRVGTPECGRRPPDADSPGLADDGRARGPAPTVVLAGALAYAMVLGFLAWSYGPTWRTVQSVMRAAAAHEPANPEALATHTQYAYEAARKAPPGERQLAYANVLRLAADLNAVHDVGLPPEALAGYRILATWYSGLAYLGLGRAEAALDSFETVRPYAGSRDGLGIETVYTKLAAAAIAADRPARAIAVTTELLAAMPKNYEAYVLRGVARAGTGDRAGALADFAAAIAIDPTRPEAPANRRLLGLPTED